MNKRLPTVVTFIFAVSVLLSGCNSEEPPSELDALIEQLQTMHITSETTPEETSDDVSVSENTEEPVTVETTTETSEEVTDTENTEAVSDNTEETTDASGDNNSSSITYNSVTVTVLSVEEDHISVEYNGAVYNIIIDESTSVFGGDISEEKTVTITYILKDDDAEKDIFATAITVLP